jgi:GntR family transcriptional regulator
VAPVPLEYALGRFYRFNREMGERGVRGSSRVLERRFVPVPVALATRLGLDPGARCLRVARLRLAGEHPVLLETSHIPEAVAAPLIGADLAEGSIYDALENHGVHVTQLVEEVLAVGLDAGQAGHFALEPGTAALALDRLARSGERVVEHRLGLAPSDRVKLVVMWGSVAPW